jgi:4-amino-4-deoxy-L-arabinose transferase-like glycosyltransferase
MYQLQKISVGRFLLVSLTIAAACMGQSLLLPVSSYQLVGWGLLAVAAVSFVVLTKQLAYDWVMVEASGQPLPLSRIAAYRPAAWGLISAAVGCGVAAYLINSHDWHQPWPALSVWATGIALFLAGAWELSERRPTFNWRSLASARVEILWLLVLTGLALVLRVVVLDTIPATFSGDEGEMGMVARAILSGELREPFVTSWMSHPTLWFFAQALSLRTFGNTVFGLRTLSALVGVASVPAMYVFARLLYGRSIAIAAAALLAVYHFHVHFSRLAVNNIVDPLVALLVFTAFLHGCKTRSAFSFAVAGVMLGVGQHFYMGARLLPLIVLAVLIQQLVMDRQWLLSLRWHLALLAPGFLLGLGPLLGFFLAHPQDFAARIALVGIFQSGWFAQQQASGLTNLQILAAQARNAFGAFTYQPDRGPFYDPHMALLDSASSVLFLFGLLVTIRRARRLDAALILAWLLGVPIFGGMMIVSTPESQRYIIAAPALCLLIALGLQQIVAAAGWALSVAGRQVYIISAIVIILLAGWNLHFYFAEYTPRNTYGGVNSETAEAVALYLHEQRDPVFAYFFGAPRLFYNNGTIRFIASGIRGSDVGATIQMADELPPLPDGLRPIFIFIPERADELRAIQERYPLGSLRRVAARSQDGLLILIYEPQMRR